MNFINYNHLFYFWIVAKEGSFTKASKKLFISQSAVSDQIHKLEDFFNEKLITRSTRSFQLTEKGQIVFSYAEIIFNTGQELLSNFSGKASKSHQFIKIGATSSLSRNFQIKFLQPILEKANTRISIQTGDMKRLLRLLQEHTIDIVLSTHPAGEVDEKNAYYTHALMQSPLCLVKKLQHREVTSGQTLKQKLISNRIFLPSTALESRSRFDYFLKERKINIDVAGEIDDIALLRLLALNGNAAVIVPKLGVIHDINTKQLTVVHEFEDIQQTFYAITRHKRFPNLIIEELVKNFSA